MVERIRVVLDNKDATIEAGAIVFSKYFIYTQILRTLNKNYKGVE